jgi:SH3-like domain-containing protein
MTRFMLVALFLNLCLAQGEALAKDDPSPPKLAEAKPVAHFGSLRAEKVNLRSGPGSDYPILWVFVRKGLPVEILAVFDTWRKIRDADGTEGWVHQGMLSGRRSVLIAGATQVLRRDPTPEAAVVVQAEPGVIATISRCDPAWCEVKTHRYRGWVQRAGVWGLETNEIIQ